MLERPKGDTKVDNKQGGPSMICVSDSPAASETRVPHPLPRSRGPCPHDQSSRLWAPRETCSRSERGSHVRGGRQGQRHIRQESACNGRRQRKFSPLCLSLGSPILNCEAPEPHHCGSWKVSTPSCIRPGRCISSYQQVHQKPVFGSKRRNTHREMWLHLSNEHLPQTLVLYKIRDGKKRFRRPGSQCAQCREAQWAQVVTTVQNRGPRTGGSAQVQG